MNTINKKYSIMHLICIIAILRYVDEQKIQTVSITTKINFQHFYINAIQNNWNNPYNVFHFRLTRKDAHQKMYYGKLSFLN